MRKQYYIMLGAIFAIMMSLSSCGTFSIEKERVKDSEVELVHKDSVSLTKNDALEIVLNYLYGEQANSLNITILEDESLEYQWKMNEEWRKYILRADLSSINGEWLCVSEIIASEYAPDIKTRIDAYGVNLLDGTVMELWNRDLYGSGWNENYYKYFCDHDTEYENSIKNSLDVVFQYLYGDTMDECQAVTFFAGDTIGYQWHFSWADWNTYLIALQYSADGEWLLVRLYSRMHMDNGEGYFYADQMINEYCVNVNSGEVIELYEYDEYRTMKGL